MYRNKAIAAVLSTTLLFGSGALSVAAENPGNNGGSSHAFDNKVIKKIDADAMYNTVDLLSKQPREAGTEGEKIAVEYIKSKFEEYGYETELQPFKLEGEWNAGTSSVTLNGTAFSGDVRSFSGSVNKSVTAPLEFVGLGSPTEVEAAELEGKIALIERGVFNFYDKIQNVLDAGAVGVIMFNREGASGNNFGYTYDGQNIPAVAITREEGLELVDQLNTETIEATVSVEGASYEMLTSYNVIAKMKPNPNKDTGQIVMIGAHHDSVHGGPGANDDASGVAGVLELARILAKTPTDTEIRFLTFGAEEKGLVGSYHYASTLTEEEVNNTVAHFQMDMIGSKDAGDLIMFTPDGEKNLVTDLGAAAGARISEVVDYGELGRSDHVPFYNLGIPAALFIHAPLEPWYHTPEDTIDHISKEKLQQVAEIVGASVYQIARKDTPALQNARVAPGPVDYDYDDRPL
ncbi:M28 family peptidase [Bacillus salacetis]|uniref:M28 family peptidase n=1 Tax=Bacillus salacetis TaxID=2315464 RepID=UPI003B9E7715